MRPPFSTTPKTLTLLLLLFLSSQLLIGMILGPVVGRDLGAMQTVALVDPEVFRGIARSWGPDELKRFERHFIVDFWVHPLVYSLFLGAWTCFEAERNDTGLPMGLGVAPVLAVVGLGGLFDVMENYVHYSMLPDLANAKDEEIRLAALFANIKWAICGSTVLWCLRMAITRVLKGRAAAAAHDKVQ